MLVSRLSGRVLVITNGIEEGGLSVRDKSTETGLVRGEDDEQ
jgi:hypothetical protein